MTLRIRLLKALVLPLLFLSLIGFYLGAPPGSAGFGQVDYRMAGILVVVYHLFLMLPERTGQIPKLSSLLEIRREAALNGSTENESIRRIKMTLSGMKAADVIQENEREIRNTIERFSQLCQDGLNRLKDYKTGSSAKQVEMLKEMLRPTGFETQWSKKHASGLRELSKQVETAIHRFKRDVITIERTKGVLTTNIDLAARVIHSLESTLEDIKGKVKLFEEKALELRTTIQNRGNSSESAR